MTRKRKTVIVSMYVAFAGLLLAMGAAAHYSKGVSGQPTPAKSAGQKGQTKTGQGMMGSQMGPGMMRQKRNTIAAREKVRDLVDDLMDNQAAMEEARSVRSMKPLLKRNRVLLEKLCGDVAQSWGMHGPMYGAAMTGRTRSTAPARRARAAKASRTAASSAAQSRLLARGKEVFAAHGCRVCHGAEGTGTAAGPSLVGVGKKYSAEKIGDLIRHPASARMPAFSESALPSADLKAVIAYVETLKK